MSEWPDFEIPETWSLTPIEELAETLRAGGTPSRKNKAYFDGGIPFAIIEDITGCGTYLDSTKQAITREGLEASSAWIVPEGSVLLSMYATIGATAINTIPVATNQAILAIVPKETCHPEFLCFCLQAHKRHLAQLNVESTQKNVNKGIVSSFRLPLPPLQEQKSIANILLAVQRAIEAQERIIQTTTELKQALMQKLFSEGLRGEPQKETEIGLIPESWEVCTVGDVAMIQSGGTPSRENPDNWIGGTIPWVKTGEINYRTIIDTEEKINQHGLNNSSARIFPEGTLLMAMYGQGITRGRVGILGIEAATNQACAAIIPLDESRTQTDFLYYFFEYNYESLRLMGHGANQKNLSATLIKSLSLPLPPTGDQRLICQTLSTFDVRIKIARNKMSELLSLSQSLLNDLMNGTISTKQIHPTTELS